VEIRGKKGRAGTNYPHKEGKLKEEAWGTKVGGSGQEEASSPVAR